MDFLGNLLRERLVDGVSASSVWLKSKKKRRMQQSRFPKLPDNIIHSILEMYVEDFWKTELDWEDNVSASKRRKLRPRIIPLLWASKYMRDSTLPLLYRQITFHSASQYHDFMTRPHPTSYQLIRSMTFLASLSAGTATWNAEAAFRKRLEKYGGLFQTKSKDDALKVAAGESEKGCGEELAVLSEDVILRGEGVNARVPCFDGLFPIRQVELINGAQLLGSLNFGSWGLPLVIVRSWRLTARLSDNAAQPKVSSLRLIAVPGSRSRQLSFAGPPAELAFYAKNLHHELTMTSGPVATLSIEGREHIFCLGAEDDERTTMHPRLLLQCCEGPCSVSRSRVEERINEMFRTPRDPIETFRSWQEPDPGGLLALWDH